MKYKYLIFILIMFICLIGIGGVNAYTNDCAGQRQWLDEAINSTILFYKGWQETDITIDNGETTITNWSSKNSAYGENITLTSDEYYIGSESINFTYNMTNGGYTTMIKTLDSGGNNLTNYTGVEFWIKSDGENNYIQPQLQEKRGASYITWQYRNNIILNNLLSNRNPTNNWSNLYLDFSNFYNFSNSSQAMTFSDLNNITIFKLTIGGGIPNQQGVLYLDDIKFVDFDKGSTNLYKNYLKNDMARDGRDQEGIFNLVYMYNDPLSEFYHNETILNMSIAMGDWLVRNQLNNGGWQEYSLQVNCSPASIGFPVISFFKAYMLLKNNSRMDEYVNDYFIGNITNKTRGQRWNESFFENSKYVYNWGFPSTWYSNQYTLLSHFSFLYYNFTKNQTFLDESNLILNGFNNAWQLNRFGFLPENNDTNARIGFDGGYFGVGIVVLADFYADYQSNLLKEIFSKMDKIFVNIPTNQAGNWYIANSSRGNTYFKGNTDKLVTKVANENNLFYLQQMNYNASNNIGTVSTSITGGAFQPNSSTESAVQSTNYAVDNYIYCTLNETDNGYVFPRSYKFWIYNLLNQTNWTTKGRILSNASINQISLLEFPQVVAWWNSNFNYSASIYNFDVTNSISGNWYLFNNSNSGTNLSLFNLSSPLLSFSNGTSIYQSGTNLQYNLSLKPNEWVYIMEDLGDLEMKRCNDTINYTFINFTFMDEKDNSLKLNGTIEQASFTYFADGFPVNVSKTYSFTSIESNITFPICIKPTDKNYWINYTVIYKGEGGYGERTKSTNGFELFTNTTKQVELSLLNSTNTVTFQVINTFNQNIQGAYVYVLPYLNDTLLSSGYTDSSGIIQFLLQNGTTYRLFFSKAGYEDYSVIQTVTSDYYTITLSGLGIVVITPPDNGGGNTSIPNSLGVTYSTKPTSFWLNNGTYYTFSYTINPNSWKLDSWGFNLTDQDNNLINSDTSTDQDGGVLSVNESTSNYTKVIMNFYYIINGNRTDLKRVWTVLDLSDNNFSIKHAIDDATSYINSGLFGLTSQGLSFIVFFIIFIGTGVLSYKYGLTSPVAISGFVFAMIWLFDISLGWIPNPVSAVPHFATLLIAVTFLGFVIREVTQ